MAVVTCYLTISFIQRVAPTDLSYAVEVSSDVINWRSGSSDTTQFSVTAIDNATQRVVVRDNTPATGAAKRFIRLKVSH